MFKLFNVFLIFTSVTKSTVVRRLYYLLTRIDSHLFIIWRSKVLEKFETTILDNKDISMAGASILKYYFGDVFQRVLNLNKGKDFLRDKFVGTLKNLL
jgi:hypothetical protein